MDTQLLLALAGIAALAGVGFWAYTAWQTHLHRKRLEESFTLRGEGERAESEAEDRFHLFGPTKRSTAEQQESKSNEPRRPERPPEHPRHLHRRVDLMVTLTAPDAISLAQLRETLIDEFADAGDLPMRWHFFDDTDNDWQLLTIESDGTAHKLLAALQLCDRSGPIGEREYLRFTGGIERVADRLGLVFDQLEPRTTVLRRAQELDRFCHEVDLQIAINLKPREGLLRGTKVRAAVEAYGMRLDEDGIYRLYDESGQPLFALMDAAGEPFIAAEMRVRQVPGVTLLLETARIPTVAIFDRMVAFAEKLKKTLDAEVVTDDGAPLSPEAIKWLRTQTEKSHERMRQFEVPPGSPLAQRLFR